MTGKLPGGRNHLAQETSPYLLQHAANPVHWYPWGEEALARARELERPIFLSIGYSACHWCHVMAHESFEDASLAELLNRFFVSIKVDREERPDLDEIYMLAVQSLTGQGGWPMSLFLTPALEPFFGGTYFPPDSRDGRPGFRQVLEHVIRLWETNREEVLQQGQAICREISAQSATSLWAEPSATLLHRSLQALEKAFDPDWGGFGPAPKFPRPLDIRLALRHHRRTGNPRPLEMALTSLDRMAAGGIHDQLGGGFARYSTDEKWLVPHFEKMLYDNALLVPAWLEAFQITGQERHAAVVRHTCAWLLKEMQTQEGGFASSLDADSEGEEGRFYVWSLAELREVLGEEQGEQAALYFGVTAAGNFERGLSVLWRPEPEEELARTLGIDPEELARNMQQAQQTLLLARSKRVRPGRDDKLLTAWNGLAISALAQAFQVLGDPQHLAAAQHTATFLLEKLRQEDGRLHASYRLGRARFNGCLDDHAFLIQGLLDLYEADFQESWLQAALSLEEIAREQFEDPENGGFFTTGRDHEPLIARLKSPHDGALPAGNGVQAQNLIRLGAFTGSEAFMTRARRTLQAFGEPMNRFPGAFSQMLMALDMLRGGPLTVVVAGDPKSRAVEEMLCVVRQNFLPHVVVALAPPQGTSLLTTLCQGKSAGSTGARAYLCRGSVCQAPLETPEELARKLRAPGQDTPAP